MNKLMIMPLAFMFLLTIFAMMYTGNTYTDTTEDYSKTGELTINATEDDAGEIEIPGAGEQELNVWDNEDMIGAMIIIGIAIAVGIVAGVTVLGSGLKEFSQTLIFNSILFMGLWAVLTVIASAYMFATSIATVFWFSLTTIYMIGLGIHMSGTGESA